MKNYQKKHIKDLKVVAFGKQKMELEGRGR